MLIIAIIMDLYRSIFFYNENDCLGRLKLTYAISLQGHHVEAHDGFHVLFSSSKFY